MIMNNFMSGVAVAAGVLFTLSISNGLSSYVLSGSTLQEKIDERMGSA